ncbi:MAG: biopolymer transporter ExbD [Gammaproteobacteria bacterium]|nr:biopolymer transporter ExbD [Gammaproteobacteria bacterium]MCP5135201.1 biopolymer transporter ExbD [Gammaproteobacteria bacterium]
MNLRPDKPEAPEVNLTPLIDVVFLLLIFFMVSTTFTQRGEIKVDLPEASTEQVEARKEPLRLTIDADGAYFLDGKPLEADGDAIRDALHAAAGGDLEQTVIIRADAQSRHQDVVRAMDASSRAGLNHMSIATTVTDSAEPSVTTKP